MCNFYFFKFFPKESSLTGWHLVGHSGRAVWSAYRQSPPHLSIQHADVVTELGSSYYWNAPAAYLGNKVANTPKEKHTYLAKHVVFILYYKTSYCVLMQFRRVVVYKFRFFDAFIELYYYTFMNLLKQLSSANRNCLCILILF